MEIHDNLIELIIDDEKDGVFAISFVENPAIKSNFIALSNSEIKLRVTNEEKRIVTGSILIPEQAILRADEDGNPYHVYFSKSTVEKLSQKYLQDHNQGNVTLEHQVDVPDIVLVESWIKIDGINDKSVALSLDAPIGTWVGSFKVNNNIVWEHIVKTGMVKGFSVEALMKKRKLIKSEIDMSDKTEMDNKTLFDKLVEFFSAKEEVVETAPEVVEEVKEVAPEYVTKADFENAIERISEMLNPKEEEVIEAKEVVVEEVKEEEVEMVSLTENKNDNRNAFQWQGKLSLNERIKHNLNLN